MPCGQQLPTNAVVLNAHFKLLVKFVVWFLSSTNKIQYWSERSSCVDLLRAIFSLCEFCS